MPNQQVVSAAVPDDDGTYHLIDTKPMPEQDATALAAELVGHGVPTTLTDVPPSGE